jgi:LacI family transcriptional regulator
MVTIKDIAREVGVSPSTVSRALSGSLLISETTKQRVNQVAQKLGYERNELAHALVKGSSEAIGLIILDITNTFFADIARGVGEAAHASGYGVILCNTTGLVERETSYIRLLRRKRVDGLILATSTFNDPSTRDLSKTKTPFILVSRIC